MGANAVTSIPDFVALQVLTAAELDVVNCGIPVFATTTTRDDAFGGSGEKTLAQGQFCYLESTGKLQVYTGSSWSNVGTQTQVEAFTASGTWTVPAGVTYAVATILGGGGGSGTNAGVGGTGGTSSVAFAGGTVSAIGGLGAKNISAGSPFSTAGTANSGQGATISANTYVAVSGFGYAEGPGKAQDGALITAGAAVTPAASITVTVGAGGAAGSSGAAGGSGYVYITYEV
jgi:hypothetical protein